MSKGLEALNHLFDVVCSECKHKFYKKGIECSNQCNIPEVTTTIKKELKALKIIVKKANIRLYERNGRYYFKTTNNLYEISKEKYDLLMEVL